MVNDNIKADQTEKNKAISDESIYKPFIEGDVEAVKQFIASGTNVNIFNKDGITPLYFACKYGHLEIAKLLITNGAKLNADVGTAINTDGVTPLHFACKYGHLKIAKLLIAMDVDVNATTNDGITPLHIASQYGHFKVARKLIENGARIDTKTEKGETPLSIASEYEHNEIAELIKAHLNKAETSQNKGLATPLYEQHLAEAVNNVRLDENPSNIQ